MTLAARCPSCRTAFRVVQDQLKVSNGWVRCGRCAAVFNANETLFELEARAPAAAPFPPPPPPAAPPTPAVAVVPGTPITASGGLAAAATAPEESVAFDHDSAWNEPLPTPRLSVDE
uniref:zinc-ribbon domain-containing protein n=1 Tax=Azohydromonas sediminis TaxID=2259674 RepID=UPI001B357A37